MAVFTSILSQEAIAYVEMMDDLRLERAGTRYRFMGHAEYKRLLSRNIALGMRIYWTEMLERAHMAAVTSILRCNHWLSAVVAAKDHGNALGFAASFRGFMESAADSATALAPVSLTLSENHSSILECLEGAAHDFLSSERLENELIHYSHGRYIKGSERNDTPLAHRARETADYFKIFGDLHADKIGRCYRFLCDMTHPGAPSVFMWLSSTDAEGSELFLSPGQDQVLIESFSEQSRDISLELLVFAYNPAVLTLSVLNYFPIGDLHTPGLLTWALEGIPGWVRCLGLLEANGAIRQARA